MRIRPKDPWRLPLNARNLVTIAAKGLEIPDKWTAAQFALKGRLLILAIDRMAKLAQRRAAPIVAKKARAIFRAQMEEVIARATRKHPSLRSASVTADILLPQHEALWMSAIDEVFRGAGLDIQLEIVPPIQSVLAQGYSKTGLLLSQVADADRNAVIARDARTIASKITGINDTTRDLFHRVIRSAIDENQTVVELARQFREDVLPMQFSRSMTIARTELSNAWAMGSAAAFLESDTLTQVSVIGCQAREANNKWQYRGESTCNYVDLPITELPAFMEIGWHPNHTGTLIPSGFRE